jgi:transcriptional regulator of aromatic amino acid metabolism
MSSVLILGETGTGKELIARALHNTSSGKKKTMIKINCAALPANLIESELSEYRGNPMALIITRDLLKKNKIETASNDNI